MKPQSIWRTGWLRKLIDYKLGPAEKEIMQTEPVQVIVLILAETPKTTLVTLPICPLVEIPKGFSGP